MKKRNARGLDRTTRPKISRPKNWFWGYFKLKEVVKMKPFFNILDVQNFDYDLDSLKIQFYGEKLEFWRQAIDPKLILEI